MLILGEDIYFFCHHLTVQCAVAHFFFYFLFYSSFIILNINHLLVGDNFWPFLCKLPWCF